MCNTGAGKRGVGGSFFFFLMTFHLPMSMNYISENMNSDKELLLSLKASHNLEY